MTSIFIRGFDFDTDEQTLKSHFSKIGPIEDLFFQSNGSAVISYKTADAANRAVEELDGSTMKGQQRYCSVKLDDPDREGKGKGKGKGKGGGKGSRSSDGTAVFANGFEYDTDDFAIKKHFGKVGKISDLHFQSKGSAVIVYEDADAADRAVSELDGSTMKGQERYVTVRLDDPDRGGKDKGKGKGKGKERSKGGSNGGSGNAVYASGFEFSTDEAVLKKHFSKVGEVTDLYFQSKGSAVISYEDSNSANRAVSELDGSTIKGQERYVAVHLDSRSGKGKW